MPKKIKPFILFVNRHLQNQSYVNLDDAPAKLYRMVRFCASCGTVQAFMAGLPEVYSGRIVLQEE